MRGAASMPPRGARRGRVAAAALWALIALLALECRGQLPHQRLGVAPDTPPAELKRAYRKRCLELHPDKHKGEANKAWAEKEFMALGKAYETMLANAVRRYQGASSRPTRAGTGSRGGTGARGPSDDRRSHEGQQRARPPDSASDQERAERQRMERERRAGRGGGARAGAGGRGGGGRSSADERRQREREREFRRLQEEERRWQQHARARQQQQQQQQQQQWHDSTAGGGWHRGGGARQPDANTMREVRPLARVGRERERERRQGGSERETE